MAVDLPIAERGRARALFAELTYHLSIEAVLAGAMPGRVLADRAEDPQAALVASPEGCYLAACWPPSAAVGFGRAAVARLLAGWPALGLFVAPAWRPQIGALCAGLRYELHPRRRYALGRLAEPWHRRLPDGYRMARIDAATLARPDLADHHIRSWASGNWGSADQFLARGFGFAVFEGPTPVSWCLADSAVGDRCEVGIRTHPEHRRRGLATAAVAAAVAHALDHGFTEVGWHCGEENAGSQGVAEKVGFRLTDRFDEIYCRHEEGATP